MEIVKNLSECEDLGCIGLVNFLTILLLYIRITSFRSALLTGQRPALLNYTCALGPGNAEYISWL
jgi:hypothetical protein